jgi:hypothetical protein
LEAATCHSLQLALQAATSPISAWSSLEMRHRSVDRRLGARAENLHSRHGSRYRSPKLRASRQVPRSPLPLMAPRSDELMLRLPRIEGRCDKLGPRSPWVMRFLLGGGWYGRPRTGWHRAILHQLGHRRQSARGPACDRASRASRPLSFATASGRATTYSSPGSSGLASGRLRHSQSSRTTYRSMGTGTLSTPLLRHAVRGSAAGKAAYARIADAGAAGQSAQANDAESRSGVTVECANPAVPRGPVCPRCGLPSVDG